MATNSLELEEQLDRDEIYRLISSMSDEEFNRMTDPTHYETHLIPSSQPHPKEPRFAMPKSDKEIASAKQNAVPQNTSKINNWCVAIWEEWTTARRNMYVEYPPPLLQCSLEQLNNWLSRFALEVRRKDGEPYPPSTLYSIVCGLQRHIREVNPTISFFNNPELDDFKKILDGEMKRLRSLGLGVKKKQAEPITTEEENKLWEQGVLGNSSPQVLLDTMVFLCEMYFALRSAQEHRSLQCSQIELFEPQQSPPYLVYNENYSKNNTGGIAQRKIKPKTVTHHANTNPS